MQVDFAVAGLLDKRANQIRRALRDVEALAALPEVQLSLAGPELKALAEAGAALEKLSHAAGAVQRQRVAADRERRQAVAKAFGDVTMPLFLIQILAAADWRQALAVWSQLFSSHPRSDWDEKAQLSRRKVLNDLSERARCLAPEPAAGAASLRDRFDENFQQFRAEHPGLAARFVIS